MNEKREPLTLEQLREMVGMPVWIERNDPPHDGKWDLVDYADIENTDKTLYTKSGVTYSEYGKYFTAYVSAPPIGRCGECKHWYKQHCAHGPCATEPTDADFSCGGFEPKGGKENG